ncbi:MAG: hypothetical protein ABH952_05665 [Candidatus Omnitrophota bacterium]
MAKKEKEDKVLDEIKRHNKVLMEHMEKQVKTVAEQYGSIMNKLEDHDEKFERMGSELETVKMAVIENSANIKVLKMDTAKLKAGQETIKARQERMEQKLDNNLANHEKRITKIEEKVGV